MTRKKIYIYIDKACFLTIYIDTYIIYGRCRHHTNIIFMYSIYIYIFFYVEKCRIAIFHGGKVIQMATFVGPVAEYECDVDLKIFNDPKRECINEGTWTRIKPLCNSKLFSMH